MSIKVSVILPSLNVAQYIEQCMDSVVNQTLQELEIICVDAGSSDGTKEILERYARRDSRIIILYSNIKSYGRQVNMGLDYATGDYIAVLETDDWVEPDMYQCLYECALKDQLDYVAADFDKFYQLYNGNYYYVRQCLFGSSQKDWYGKVLYSDQLAVLRSSDYTLWRGIYNREFLNYYHIRLHESSGAAFQDMGFLQQVKTYARKAKYIDRSFYRYRQDRENTSSKGLEGLENYKNEFNWINEELGFGYFLEGIHRRYYYYTMSISFITKYEQVLRKLNGDWQDQRLDHSYNWFQSQISDAVEKGILDEKMYGHELWKRLMLLLYFRQEHVLLIVDEQKEKQRRVQVFFRRIANHPIIIFGCGIRGGQLMFFCDRNHIRVCSFCDNDQMLWGKEKCGYTIISPAILKSEAECNNALILLSMKNGRGKVHSQLIKMGLKSDRIIDQLPEGMF